MFILKDDPFEEEKAPISSRSYLGIADGVNFGDYNSPSFGDCHDRHFATKTTTLLTNGDCSSIRRSKASGGHFDEENSFDSFAQVMISSCT